MEEKVIAKNKVLRDFEIIDKIEAGIELQRF